jgi:hypothetical protein
MAASIPARPWAVVQDEDYDSIEAVFAKWLKKKMSETRAFTPGGG